METQFNPQFTSEDCTTLYNTLSQELNKPGFSPEVFTLVLEMGGCYFTKYSGATNLTYQRGTATRPTYLRMDLPANEAGFDRLKIHYLPTGTVRMEFYPLLTLASGRRVKGTGTVVEAVEFEFLLDVFEEVTGLYMNGRDAEGGEADPDPDFF